MRSSSSRNQKFNISGNLWTALFAFSILLLSSLRTGWLILSLIAIIPGLYVFVEVFAGIKGQKHSTSRSFSDVIFAAVIYYLLFLLSYWPGQERLTYLSLVPGLYVVIMFGVLVFKKQ